MKRLVVLTVAGATVLGLAACSSSTGSSSAGDSSAAAPAATASTSAAASSAAATSPSAAPAVAAPASLMDPAKLQVCSYIAFPPLEFKDKNSDEPTGFDIEAAQAVANYWGIQAEFTDMGFDGLLPALDAKRCDVVWSGMFLNDDRQKKADAAAYFKTGDGLLVAKGNPAGITTADDLAGKRLAVAAGTTAVDTAKQLSDGLVAKGLEPIDVQKYPTLTAEVGAVKAGKADAVLELDVALADAVRTAPDSFELVPQAFPAAYELAAYTQKGSGLASEIQNAWAALIADGTAAALAEKYAMPVENLTSTN
mgnify:CR=1 FL=1